MTSLITSTAAPVPQTVTPHTQQAIPTITLYIDPNGNAWQRTYVPVSAETVNDLRLLHRLGGVDLQEQDLPQDDFRATEMAWLQDHLPEIAEQYAGQWIAIQGAELVAHSGDLEQLYAAAAAAGHADPFVTAVPAEPAQLFIA